MWEKKMSLASYIQSRNVFESASFTGSIGQFWQIRERIQVLIMLGLFFTCNRIMESFRLEKTFKVDFYT